VQHIECLCDISYLPVLDCSVWMWWQLCSTPGARHGLIRTGAVHISPVCWVSWIDTNYARVSVAVVWQWLITYLFLCNDKFNSKVIKNLEQLTTFICKKFTSVRFEIALMKTTKCSLYWKKNLTPLCATQTFFWDLHFSQQFLTHVRW